MSSPEDAMTARLTAGRFVTRLVGLISVVFSCAAGTAQTPGISAPMVTEARRREILQAAEALTSETFADALRKAEAGDVEAQVLVGLALDHGNGVTKDPAKAVEWFRKAAEAGHPIGQNSLALAYADGNGLPQDLPKAFEWYAKAAAQGYSSAQANLGRLYYNGRGRGQNCC